MSNDKLEKQPEESAGKIPLKRLVIRQGQIYEVVTRDFFSSVKGNDYNRQVRLGKGEKIEIRYPYEWHFRTEDNHYFHATPEMIEDNCTLIGVVIPAVKFKNKANLEEILRLGLFEAV